MASKSESMGRRTLLRIGVTGIASAAAGSTLTACAGHSRTSGAASNSAAGPVPPAAQSDASPKPAPPRRNVLLVFFSRAGENYFNGGRKNLSIGNTQVAADMIRDALGCDVYQIQPSEPYSDSYEETVQRNVREQEQESRPEIANPLGSLDSYDTILIGSPVWNVRVPRIMLTFTERFDFTGKTLYPFTTYAVSGLGSVIDDYTAGCRGATIREALAVRGEEVDASRPRIENWLRGIGLLT